MTGEAASEPMQRFMERVEELAGSQEELRCLIENDKRRRRRSLRVGIVAFCLAVYTAITLHDQHVRHCMLPGEPSTRAEQRICNLTIFGHDHEIGFDPEAVERLRDALGLEGATP